MSENNPIQLLQKIVEKDRKAFEAFYDRFAGLIYAFAVRLLKNTQAAEELVQDVFLEVWNKAENYSQSRGNPEAWLTMITRSRAIDRLRSSKRVRMNTQPMESLSAADNIHLSIHSSALASDAKISLDGVLNKISEDKRAVLELAYFEGLTQSEIAERLDLPLGTVKTRIREGLAQLRVLLTRKEKVISHES